MLNKTASLHASTELRDLKKKNSTKQLLQQMTPNLGDTASNKMASNSGANTERKKP